MLSVGENIWNGHVIRVVVDETTGRTKVYIPAINSPSPDPVADYDPAVTLATISYAVSLIMAAAGLL